MIYQRRRRNHKPPTTPTTSKAMQAALEAVENMTGDDQPEAENRSEYLSKEIH
jgi:hypothetical protein